MIVDCNLKLSNGPPFVALFLAFILLNKTVFFHLLAVSAIWVPVVGVLFGRGLLRMREFSRAVINNLQILVKKQVLFSGPPLYSATLAKLQEENLMDSKVGNSTIRLKKKY